MKPSLAQFRSPSMSLVHRWRSALILLALAACSSGLVQAQTFLAAPPSGPGPFIITWDVPNGTACQAAGIADWSGAVAASGTKSVQPAVGTKTLTIACTVPGPPQKGSVTLNWVPATQNVDNTAYTNAKDVRIMGQKSTPPAVEVTAVPVGTNTYVADNLDAGKWYFGAISRNTANVSSALSTVVSADVVDKPTTQPWTGSATIEVTAPAKPKAPILSIASP